MAAAAIDSRTTAEVRKTIGQFRPGGGQARRHFHKESAVTRRKMLDTYRTLPEVSIVVAEDQGGTSAVDQRRRCLTVLVATLLPLGVDRLVFDHTDPAQRDRDRQVLAPLLARTGVTYSHEVAHTPEPTLWIPAPSHRAPAPKRTGAPISTAGSPSTAPDPGHATAPQPNHPERPTGRRLPAPRGTQRDLSMT